MLTDFLSVEKTLVFTQSSGPKGAVGKLVDFVINPDTGAFEAFWIQTTLGLRILSPKDILRWHRGKILITDLGDFALPDQLPRLQKIMENEIPILGAKVFSVRTTIEDLAQQKMGTKTFIGRVTNFSFDTLSPRLVTIVTRSGALWWEKRRIISRTRILKVEKEGILVSENQILVDEKPIPEGKKQVSKVE